MLYAANITLSNILRQPEMATWIVDKPFLCFLHGILWISLMHFISLVLVEFASTDVESATKAPWAPSVQYPQKSLMVTWITVNPFYSVSSQQLSNFLRQPEMATWIVDKPSLCFLHEILWISFVHFTSLVVVECPFTDVESATKAPWAPSIQYPQKALMVTWITVNPSFVVGSQHHPIQHSQTTRYGDMNC